MTGTSRIATALVTALALCGCGRYGFGNDVPSSGDSADAPPAQAIDAPQAAIDAPQTLITCNQPTPGSGNVIDNTDQLSVAASSENVYAVSTDKSQVLEFWSFNVAANGAVTPNAQGTTIATNTTGTIGVLATADGPLVTSSYAGGTMLYPLNPDGTQRAAPVSNSADAATGSLAASGVDGTLAFVTYAANGDIVAQLINSVGVPSGAQHTIIPGAIGAGSIVIAPAATGWVVTYTDPSVSPHATALELLDNNLAVVTGPVTASTNPYGSEVGTVAWASSSHRYLVAWQNKDDTDADEIQIREYDSSLVPLAGSDTTIMTNTGEPQLASDGTGFSVTGRGWSPDALKLDYIGPNGAVTPQTDTVDVNTFSWASATTLSGQPVVAWLTDGQLWVDVPCAP